LNQWYEKWFADKFYLELYQHRDEEDARWFINLLQRTINVSTHCSVLDIACGSGRHSIELARRGFNVTGFDLSKFLINEAKKNLKNSPEKNLRVKFLNKDMRNFNFRNSFDIAINIFTSFGYFESDEENFRVFKNVSASLKKNGHFVFDFLNKEYLEKNLIPFTRTKKNGFLVEQTRKLENGFVKKKIVIKNKNSSRQFDEILRLYSLIEFKRALASYNLEISRIFGDYNGNSYNKNKSQRLIIFATKI